MGVKPNILIYNDSPIFGGHEIMTIEIANILSSRYKVHFLFYHPKIGYRLNNNVVKIPIKISSKTPLPGIRSFNIIEIVNLMKIIKPLHIDLAIISQGNIELSLKGAIATKLLDIKTVSYIPLCFSFQDMGARFARIRDFFNKKIYSLFDTFITISNEQKKLIHFWNKEANVFVLPNIVNLENISYAEENTIKFTKLSNKLRIGIIGRIYFKQKGQDKLIKIAKVLKQNQINFSFIVIGDGPDRSKLEYLIKKENLEDVFTLTGWIDKKEEIYRMIDLLLITSNFEGLPLNMLEAIIAYKPVIAPFKGIFLEYLPQEMLYKTYKDILEFIKKFLKNPNLIGLSLIKTRNKILQIHSKENFEKKLFEIMNKIIQ